MRGHRVIASAFALSVATGAFLAVPAAAADMPVPSKEACSVGVDGSAYACMKVADQTVPSGKTVTFTGQLSPTAYKNLKAWTKGDNIVCLERFKPKPEADGSWPWTTMEAACTTVRKSGAFTINAEFGRKGTFYYGLEMGPCRASKAMCGDGDPGLIGVIGIDKKVVAVKTT